MQRFLKALGGVFLSGPLMVLLLASPCRAEALDVPSRIDARLRKIAETPILPPVPRKLRRFRRRQVASAIVREERLPSLELLSNAHMPNRILMVLTPETVDEAQGVARALFEMRQRSRPQAATPITLHLFSSGDHDPDEIGFPAELEDLVELDEGFQTDDVWIQDWGEIALRRKPGSNSSTPVVLEFSRGRGLMGFGDHLGGALDLPVHVVEGSDGPGDYGGNVEVTPDGIVVLGSTVSESFENFFNRVGYGGKVILLDTHWLDVGHVDELVAFLPYPEQTSESSYMVVHPDPQLGLDLLGAIDDDAWGEHIDALIDSCMGASNYAPLVRDEAPEPLAAMVQDLDGLRAAVQGFPRGERDLETREDLRKWLRFNREAGGRILKELQYLSDMLQTIWGEPRKIRFLPVPSLWKMGDEGKAVSLLPEATNMVVLPRVVLLPDPLLPSFRNHVEKTLRGAGYTPNFIPELTYHLGQGQLHCATYVVREGRRWPGR